MRQVERYSPITWALPCRTIQLGIQLCLSRSSCINLSTPPTLGNKQVCVPCHVSWVSNAQRQNVSIPVYHSSCFLTSFLQTHHLPSSSSFSGLYLPSLSITTMFAA